MVFNSVDGYVIDWPCAYLHVLLCGYVWLFSLNKVLHRPLGIDDITLGIYK